jgi:hypothetical protein
MGALAAMKVDNARAVTRISATITNRFALAGEA